MLHRNIPAQERCLSSFRIADGVSRAYALYKRQSFFSYFAPSPYLYLSFTMTTVAVFSPVDSTPKSTMTAAAASSTDVVTKERNFICIDLSDFDNRRDEITADLMRACTGDGFFYGKHIIKCIGRSAANNSAQ